MPTSDSATQNPATTPTTPTLDPDFTPVEISDAPGSTTDLATLIDRVNALQEQVAAMTPEVITARDSLSQITFRDNIASVRFTTLDDGVTPFIRLTMTDGRNIDCNLK